MNKQLRVSSSIEIHALPEKVWIILTQPKYIREYLYGTETLTDWEMGSPIIFQGVYNDIPYKDKGIVLDYIPFQKISYSYWSSFSGLEDIPENYSIITYSLYQLEGGRTRFNWTQEGYSSEEGRSHSELGMAGLLNSIKEITERSKI